MIPLAGWAGVGLVTAAVLAGVALIPSRPSAETPSPNPGIDGVDGDRRVAVGLPTELMGRIMSRRGWGRHVDVFLDRAALRVRPNEFVTLVVGATLLTFVAVSFAGIGLLGYVITIGAPIILGGIVKLMGRHRMGRFQTQLPNTFSQLSGSVRAGHGLMKAVHVVSQKAPEPTASEFQRAIAEAQVGRNPMDALQGVADRMGSDDFTWAVRGIELNREVGGNLAELLDNLSRTMREKSQLQDQVKALSAAGRFSAGVLLILPFLVVGAISFLNPEYISVLWTTRNGFLMVAIALGLMAVGALVIRKMIRIEY